MTVEEKREALREYCRKTGDTAQLCVLKDKDWQHKCASCMNYDCDCLYISAASEEELDEALRLIKKEDSDKGTAQVLAQIKELKSAAAVIQLEVTDCSPMQIAHAICNFFEESWDTEEGALIELDELTEHIDAYVRAEREKLKYKKLSEEG